MSAMAQKELNSEQLLQERQRLEKLYQEQFTREITVMFTDLKDSTALTESEGDLSTRELIQKHNSILFPLIEKHQGVLVKTMGDGTMSYFDLAQNAQRTAVAFQQALFQHNHDKHCKLPIQVRVGLHSGVGIVEEKDIYGDVVNVASRFESLANAGEIYMSEATYQALDNKGEFYSRRIKEASLKGKSESFAVFKVFWDEQEIEEDKENAQHLQQPAKTSVNFNSVLRVLLYVAVLLGLVFGVMQLTRLLEDSTPDEEKRSRSHKISQVWVISGENSLLKGQEAQQG